MSWIMQAGVVIFFILFLFLLMLVVVTLVSFFRKQQYADYAPHVSVIVPVYNEERHLRNCLTSIFSADYDTALLDVIVVDDGSTDASKHIAKDFPVRLLHQDHLGKPAALNRGLKEAHHDILLSIDADTILDKQCIKRIVAPFQDKSVGAVSGSCTVGNVTGILTLFQSLEYYMNNLIRHAFSSTFSHGIWFFGALACYRTSALQKIGGFSEDTLTEDTEVALSLAQQGYRTVTIVEAFGKTQVPSTIAALYKQRKRWWVGVLQGLSKHRSLLKKQSSPSIWFLFLNQYWWTFYAFLSFPLIAYQVAYWLPQTGFIDVFWYLFRWFSLSGPFYVLYKIPEWGVNILNIFGVLSGIFSCFLLVVACTRFREKHLWLHLFTIFFFFPYTIFLNALICLSVVHTRFTGETYFIK